MPFFLLEPFAALEKSGEPNWLTRILGVLIIAVVSIGLILLMQNGALFSGFTAYMDRVKACLGSGPCV